MNYRAVALSVTALAVFSACSGSNGTMPSTTTSMQPVVAPTMAASATPALPQANFTTASRGTQMGLAATNGFAVYNFDLDLTTPGLSACAAATVPPATTACTAAWPPVVPPAGVTLVAPFGEITRPEGTLQLTYNGHPLYMFVRDTTTASATGDGVTAFGGLWHLAQPADLTTADFAPNSTATIAPSPYSASRALSH
jgi:predicted lipoprotein with Yx(FWY)xxD motif